jgi:hypothetical protein
VNQHVRSMVLARHSEVVLFDLFHVLEFEPMRFRLHRKLQTAKTAHGNDGGRGI